MFIVLCYGNVVVTNARVLCVYGIVLWPRGSYQYQGAVYLWYCVMSSW